MAKTEAVGSDSDIQFCLYAADGARSACRKTAARTSLFKLTSRKKRGPFVSAGGVNLTYNQLSCEHGERSTFQKLYSNPKPDRNIPNVPVFFGDFLAISINVFSGDVETIHSVLDYEVVP